MSERTQAGGTRTSEGWIPHHQHPSGFLLPVCVTWTGDKLPKPMRRHGQLIYRLPGGGEYRPPTDKDYQIEMERPE